MALRFAVFLITLSGLIFGALTRIYSATIWYHPFVAVSVALLGWGLGGLTVHLTKRRLWPSIDKAALLCVLYSATIVLTLALVVRFPFTIDRMPMYFVAPFVPFLLAGMALSIIFDLHRQIATTLYFFDLVGASLGRSLSHFSCRDWVGRRRCSASDAAAARPVCHAGCGRRAAGAVLVIVAALTNGEQACFQSSPARSKRCVGR
jgi:hypothetical protein